MKLLINIDQKASLLQGFEAPNSAEKWDLPVASIPERIRAIIVPHYDTKSGLIRASVKVGESRGFSIHDAELGKGPICTQPLTDEKVLAALTTWAERCEPLQRLAQAKEELVAK